MALPEAQSLEEVMALVATATLEGDDAEIISVTSAEMWLGREEVVCSCFGRLTGDQDLNLLEIRGALKQAWNKKGMKIFQANHNTIQIYFEIFEDLLDVLAGGPWNYENQLLLLARGGGERGDRVPPDDDFYKCLFWVQIRGLPRDMYTPPIGKLVHGSFCPCTVIQLREDQFSGDRWFRVRALVDIRKPLRKVARFTIDDDDKEIRGLVRYECLPIFCFACGRIGHVRKMCPTVSDPLSSGSFRPWMATMEGGGRVVWSFGDGGRRGEVGGDLPSSGSLGGVGIVMGDGVGDRQNLFGLDVALDQGEAKIPGGQSPHDQEDAWINGPCFGKVPMGDDDPVDQSDDDGPYPGPTISNLPQTTLTVGLEGSSFAPHKISSSVQDSRLEAEKKEIYEAGRFTSGARWKRRARSIATLKSYPWKKDCEHKASRAPGRAKRSIGDLEEGSGSTHSEDTHYSSPSHI